MRDRLAVNRTKDFSFNCLRKFNWEPTKTDNKHILYKLCTMEDCSQVGLNEFIELMTYKMSGDIVYLQSEPFDKVERGKANNLCTIFKETALLDDESEEILLTLPQITVSIGAVSLIALIDSGSEVTCIRYDEFERVKKQVTDLAEIPIPSIQIAGAFSISKEKVGKLVTLPLKLGNLIVYTPMLVLRYLPKQLILGFDFLKQTKATITCGDSNKLIINDNEKQCEIMLEGNYSSSIEGSHCFMMTDGIPEVKINRYVESLDLPSEHKEKLLSVLLKNKELFSDKVGCTDRYVHEIKMRDDSPFIKRSYPIPHVYREKVAERINQMEKLNLISRQTTDYCSPLTCTLKRNGDIRILLDARELNKRMVGEVECAPLMTDILQSGSKISYLAVVDIKDAYFSVKLSSESRKYTGFVFQNKSYVYNVLPQGLKTSVGSFSRAMDLILGPEIRTYCLQYLDDLLIITEQNSLDHHLLQVDAVLTRLREAGFVCTLEKCNFAAKSVTMLGFVLSTKGVSIHPEKAEAVRAYPTPKTTKQVRSFLGFMNYFRRFIRNFGILTQPLYNLLRTGVRFYWDEKLQNAFDELKSAFSESVMLSQPDFSAIYYVQTDASSVGIGGYLYQIDKNNDEKVIGFCSYAFKGAQLRWTVSEQEMYAVIYTLKKFETYLRGAKIIIKTDHRSLTFVKSWTLLSARVTRWIQFLEQFNYEIQYVTGRDNTVADILSRNIQGTDIGKIRNSNVTRPSIYWFRAQNHAHVMKSLRNIIQLQKQDERLNYIMEAIDKEEGGAKVRGFNNYKMTGGALYYKVPNDEREVLAIPESLQPALISHIHEEIGHYGRFKVMSFMKSRYHFSNMSRKVGQIVRACDICQKVKPVNQIASGPCTPVLADYAGQKVFADIYGPLPVGKFGFRYIYVLQDVFSKFIKLYPMRAATGRCVLACTKRFHKELKIETIITDNGSQFTSVAWRTGLRDKNITVTYTSKYFPKANSVERVNREIGRLIRTYCAKSNRSWVDLLPEIENCYNNITHISTGYCPNELIKGRREALSTDKAFNDGWLSQHLKFDVSEARKNARQNALCASEGRKRLFDRSHKLKIFKIGDFVKLKTFIHSNKQDKISRKLSYLYDGPYVIAGVPYTNCYSLMDPKTKKLIGNYNVVHLATYYFPKNENTGK